MTFLLKIIFIILMVYAAFSALIYFKQADIIYYPGIPGRNISVTPERLGLSFDDVEFYSADKVRLHGWFIPHEKAIGTLLFFHGNAGNISHRLESIALFHQLQLNVFIFDYRGYGQSEGRTTEQGTYQDAAAAWHYLTTIKNIAPGQIIIFGRSLGASIAAWLASQHQPAGLIAESGFSSVASMAKRLYPLLPVDWLVHFKYDTAKYVSATSCPILIAHSPDDEIIPYEEARLIYQAAAEPKQFFNMRGGHNEGYIISADDYSRELHSFVRAALRDHSD